MKQVSDFLMRRKKINLSKFLGDKDVSKSLIDLKVDGLIFDHVAELKEEHSTTENLFIGKKFFLHWIRIVCLFFIVAEEREDLELLNNYRQKQLELKHRQLLQELESLKSARETNNLADSNFKHLM